MEGIFPKESCAMQTLRDNKICWQFKKLAQALDFSPTQLFAKQLAGFTIIDMFFAADGQYNYYIISKGYLIDTSIDPRKLSTVLAKKYQKFFQHF